MPLIMRVSVGAISTFDVEGDFLFDEDFISIFRAWLGKTTIGPSPQDDPAALQSHIDERAEQVDQAADTLGEVGQRLGGLSPEPPTIT